MKNHLRLRLMLVTLLFISTAALTKKQTEPWRPEQLMPPADLAATINKPATPQPLIICVGPGALIKGSVDAGPAKQVENLSRLKSLLTKEDRKRNIVIYCGCCPFKNCPNIRPAFTLLNQMGFSNQKLLDLSHNIKVDWIDHNYPVNATK